MDKSFSAREAAALQQVEPDTLYCHAQSGVLQRYFSG